MKAKCFQLNPALVSKYEVTLDQALFSLRFVNNIPAGKAKRIFLALAVRENVWEPLKLGLILG